MSEGRQPGACFAAHQDELDPGLKEERRDAKDNVAMLTVRRQAAAHQALPLWDVPRARPVLQQAAAERPDAVRMFRERRQAAQR